MTDLSFYFDKITITKPDLPELDQFVEQLKIIWDNKWLTNNGPFHDKLESALAEYLGVPYVSLFCNGTIALQTALKALKISGEVITTPFTFPATVHSIFWNQCEPVFCDISPESFSLDPDRIEPLITSKTTAIIPCHVYGKPSDTKSIQALADKFGLKVIYDAAHAFGIFPKQSGKDVWGDISMLSFHATKVFNTIEGGALIMHDKAQKERVDYLKNFGIAGEELIVGEGINGKMNEICAAFGLLQLLHVDEQIQKRQLLDARYRHNLEGIKGIDIPQIGNWYKPNFSYFPIFITDDFPVSVEKVQKRLAQFNIYGRRYFYPLVSQAPCYRTLPSANPALLPVATELSSRVFCLPLYSGLSTTDIDYICSIITGCN
ncbi:DegT/DnrJ/EryC1/StrS family aminotransferase [Maridesulfovibrio sp.]|uniref:DegT/DnrJ/EryC1/StrS family aminotransferase n=1 Tax=Maridesulfovibrio sp. TaxID=2795000 RepID=UPI0029CA584F|nr:DegT/DnrJ/EryC1/StrS family aminotransferase [Maridesulfovibrio sp.]